MKTQRNSEEVLRMGLKILWRTEIHINIKINADAQKQGRRRFCEPHKKYHIYRGQQRQESGKCAWVYGICSGKNKIENETRLTDTSSTLT